MKLFVAVLILTAPTEEERMNVLNRWIEIAIETKTVVGNLYGFTSIMLGLTLPEVRLKEVMYLIFLIYYDCFICIVIIGNYYVI